jgi:hypothetical protein
MQGNGFYTRRVVEQFLKFSPPEIREIVFELRDLVWRACPNATERILRGGLSYHLSEKGGPVKGSICQIELDKDRVRVSFIHGVRLSDPDSLLSGDRISKRSLAIKSFNSAPWDGIFNLIQEAGNLDPTTFGPLR